MNQQICTIYEPFAKRLGVKCLAHRRLSSSFSRGKRESCSFPSHLFQTNLSPIPLLPPPRLPPLPSCSPAPPLSPIPFFVISVGEVPADSVCHGNQPVVVTGPAAHTSCVCGCMCVWGDACAVCTCVCVCVCVCRQRLAAWACQPGLESNTLQRCLFSFFPSYFLSFCRSLFFIFLSFFRLSFFFEASIKTPSDRLIR